MSYGKLVDEAEARLRKWFEKSAFKPGTRIASERALAKELGLQHYSLNRAMARLIAAGKIEREGYKLFVAKTAPEQSALRCALVVARRSVHLPGYRRVAKEKGIKLSLHTWQSYEEASAILTRLGAQDADAVVLDPPYNSPTDLWEQSAIRLARQGVPLVSLGQPCKTSYAVLHDNMHNLQSAMLHLLDSGHRQIAMVTSAHNTLTAREIDQSWASGCAQLGLDGSTGRIHHRDSSQTREQSRELAELLANDWREVTGVVLYPGIEYSFQSLHEALLEIGRPVPDSVSIIFMGGATSASRGVQPVDSVSYDMPLMQEIAYDLAIRAVRRFRALGMLPPPCVIRLQARVVARGSTRALAVPPPAANERQPAPTPAIIDPKALRELETSVRRAYPKAARASLSERQRFAKLDLSGLVNRPLHFRRGWLGDLPLRQFPPGEHELHGVPFQILGGKKRSNGGAIIFHSATNTTGNAQPLPDNLRIPVGCKAEAIYVLHGCGFAKVLQPFARYRFMGAGECLGEIPLVSLGQPSADYDPMSIRPGDPVANIQDWWPDFPHSDFPNARMVPIRENGEDSRLPRHVFLYTCEWVNPHPDKVVETLEITVDPATSTTLGMLAVTVLKP